LFKRSSERDIRKEDTKLPLVVASLNARPRLSLPSVDEFAEAFRAETPSHVQVLKERLNALGQTADQDTQREILSDFFLGIHALALNAEQSQLRSSLAVASALEKLVKKPLERGQALSASILNVAITALELIEELCRAHFEPDLATPPVRILVVDDDPILRRGLSGSLQLMFGKPDTAESGEAALAYAAENRFDMIFLDVLMPGIDGFTACRKIRETDLNRQTPIVFLTSLSDLPSRDEAVEAGGSGFISKPALAAEITLTAVTFCLRARLNKLSVSHSLECEIA
jgi:PleD family two-component response regulator